MSSLLALPCLHPDEQILFLIIFTDESSEVFILFHLILYTVTAEFFWLFLLIILPVVAAVLWIDY